MGAKMILKNPQHKNVINIKFRIGSSDGRACPWGTEEAGRKGGWRVQETEGI